MLSAALIACLLAASCFAVGVALAHDDDDVTRRVLDLERSSFEGERQSKLVRSMVDDRARIALDERLTEAGWYRTTVVQYVAARVAAAVGCAVLGIGVALLLHAPFMLLIMLAAGPAVAAYIAPSFILDAAIRDRKIAIARRIPDMLDMVSTTVQAGTALNGALAAAVNGMQGPLADEFRMTLSDIRVGMSRADAFNAMARRVKQPDLSSVVTAIVQTERLGGDIARVLNELAEEARSRRLGRAEELAAKIPVKMVIPMALFMLPALFVMIFGPVAAELLTR